MHAVEHFTISEEESDKRIDVILAKRYEELSSRSYFQHLIRGGHVLVNGKEVKKQYRPLQGDEVAVAFVITKELNLSPEELPLEILYEDEYLIAVNKAAGMVVHPAPGNWSGTFVNALLYHCNNSSLYCENDYRPGIVHRLDKDTSGLLIAAKDPHTQQKLSELFSSREVSKEYIAICCGDPGEGEVDAPIGRHPIKRKEMAVRQEGGRRAITRYKSVASNGKLSVVTFDLITGRTHQIRVHMKHIGTPILGDELYGKSDENRRYQANRQILHARKLKLQHPVTGDVLTLVAPFPGDIIPYFEKLKYQYLERGY